jgi:flagellar biosynthesis chaperone FliJ
MNPRIQKPAKQGPTPAELLAKMPRRPMTAEQQAAALEKVQQQATQRVKLGQQLFEAAEAKLKQHQKVLDEINQHHERLREKVQEDVAKSLQSYDQWMGRIDEGFTKAIADLGGRLDILESRVDASRDDMQAMIERAAALLEQTQDLLAEAFGEGDEAEDDTQVQTPTPTQAPPPAMFAEDVPIDEIESIAPLADDEEVIEVEIVGQDDADHEDILPMDHSDPSPTDDDVFGEVLRRLRSQTDDDGHAAA